MTDKTTTKIYMDDLPHLEQVKRDLRKRTGEPVYNQDAIRFLLDKYLKENKSGKKDDTTIKVGLDIAYQMKDEDK